MEQSQQRGTGIRVLVVDDHEMAREGLRRMLELERDLEVVGEASSGEEALQMVELLSPDVVLMDIKMPNSNGLEATRRLKERRLPGEVMVLSLYGEYLTQAIEAGATGYMVKDVKRAELVSAVRRVAQGQLVLGGSLLNTPGITESALGHLRTMLNGRQQTRSTSTIPHQSEPSTSDSKLLLRRQVSADIQGPQRDQNVRKLTTGVPAPPVSSSPTNSEALALEERRSNKEFSTPDLGTTEGEDGLSFNDKGDEPTPAPRTKASALYESMIELAIAPPMEADTLLRFCEWLTKTTRAEIQETSGSWQEGTSLKVLLRRPLPLLEMLANSPDVIQVWEEPSEKQSMIRRFLPQRTPESAPISEPTTKLQVLLRTGSGPKQLHLAFDSPNSP